MIRSGLVIVLLISIIAPLKAAPTTLSPADTTAAFRAAGFKRVGGQWQACGDPGSASYTPGAVEQVADLNGDGRPEAVLTEGSTACFGMTGTGYALVSKQADGRWRLIDQRQGMLTLLRTRAGNGWPDLEIGGPGFCFPVLRWNGREYALHRHEYKGKRCTPPR